MHDLARQLRDGTILVHGDTIEVAGNRFQILKVFEEKNRHDIVRMMGSSNTDVEITILKMLDQDNEEEAIEQEAAVMPPAPNDKETVRDSILDKWRHRNDTDGFEFYVNGDVDNESGFSVMKVPLRFMLYKHRMTNWEKDLDEDECEYAMEHWDYIHQCARGELLGVGWGEDGQYIKNVASHSDPEEAGHRYNRGLKLAVED